MMPLLKRLALLTGPSQERLALIALYSVCAAYLVIFYHFFSLEPGPASVLRDRMTRLSMFLGIYLVPLFAIAGLTWITALVITIFKLIKKHGVCTSSAIALLAAPTVFFLLRILFSAFLSGSGRSLHRWLYYNL